MRKVVSLWLLATALLVVGPTPSDAWRQHGGGHGRVFISVGPAFWWGPPYPYPYYPAPYYVYAPPPVIVQEPPVYAQAAPAPAPAPTIQQHRPAQKLGCRSHRGPSSLAQVSSQPLSLLLQPHLLERRRPRIRIDQHQRGLLHAQPDRARPVEFEDGPESHALVEGLLDLVQHGLALLPVGLHGLLLVERVDVGIAAVGVRPVARHDFRHPRGGVAVESAPA